MKLLATIIFCVLVNTCAFGLTLEGTWKEDVNKTIKWNNEHLKTNNKYLDKLKSVLGHLYISYIRGKSCLYIEPYKIKHNGASSKMSEYFQKWKYKVIAQNEFGFIVKTSIDDTEHIEMIVFESESSIYGIRLTNKDNNLVGYRVYFKKVANIKEMSSCGV